MLRSILAAVLVCAPAFAQQPSRASLIQRLDSIASAPVRRGTVAGIAVAVVRGNDTLLMKGYGFADVENRVPVTPATVFRIGSVTKQFTSAAVMQLVEAGKISLDDPLTKYLVTFPTHGNQVLVRHLLNHTSGIPSYTDIEPFAAVVRTDLSRDSLIGIVAPLNPMFAPGSHFYYNNTGYYMLGMILERITRKSYGDYLAEKLFTPNGLSSTTYCDTRKLIPNRAQGYDGGANGLRNTSYISMELPYAAGSLCSTVGDLVSWTRSLSGGRIVNAASYAMMTTPVKLTSGRPMTYGFGLDVDSLGGHRVISHGGGINGFISNVTHLPDDSLVIAVLANTSPAPSDAMAAALARAVLGIPAPVPPPRPVNTPLSAAERARYVGAYVVTRPDGSQLTVRISEADSGRLQARGDGQVASAIMESLGNHTFTAPGLGRFTFDIVNNRAVGFLIGTGARTLEAVRKE